MAACLHVTAETANLMRCLAAGGAEAALCAANPLSTQDDVAAALAEAIEVHAVAGEDLDTYARHVGALVAGAPHVTLDDGADLLTVLHAGDGPMRCSAAPRRPTPACCGCASSRPTAGCAALCSP